MGISSEDRTPVGVQSAVFVQIADGSRDREEQSRSSLNSSVGPSGLGKICIADRNFEADALYEARVGPLSALSVIPSVEGRAGAQKN